MPDTPDGPASDVPGSQPVVSVRGEATVEAEPELVKLMISVSARARVRKEALENLSRRNAQCLEIIKSYGEAIESVQTSQLWVSPELKAGREEKVRWYRGTVRTLVAVAGFAVLGELVSRILEIDLVTVDGPWWQLRPQSPVYRQARAAAAQAAVTRATEYAEAVGGHLTSLLELADTGLASDTGPVRYAGMAAARGRVAAPGAGEEGAPVIDLEPQTQVVNASVEARFTMSQPRSLTTDGR